MSEFHQIICALGQDVFPDEPKAGAVKMLYYGRAVPVQEVKVEYKQKQWLLRFKVNADYVPGIEDNDKRITVAYGDKILTPSEIKLVQGRAAVEEKEKGRNPFD